MIESLRDSSAKRLLLFILLFLIATGLSIFLDIPVFRQVLGFVFFTFVPGLLILYILKLNKLGLAEKIVLSVGLSISFLMFAGLLINSVYPLFGYGAPLSTNSLLISFSVILLILAIIAYLRNRTTSFVELSDFKLDTTGKALLLLPAFFPLLSILGMHLMNTTDNNVMLMALLFLIPAYAIVIAFQRHKLPSNTYPIAIIFISFALLSMFWLRSEHILGHDVHTEYYIFHTTLLNQRWSILGHSTLDSCLSISLLPAIYQSLLHINGEEYLFKGVYAVVCSFTPLSIYVIAKRYFGELYAFLAALFFIFQGNFLVAAGSPRTNLAIFFLALSIMVLFHNKISGATQKGLFITFMFATIVSHYTTTYIFFFLLLFAYLGGWILRKYTPPRSISLTLVGLFFASIFLWYSQITEAPFNSGVMFIGQTIRNLQLFFVEEARGPQVGLLLGVGMGGKPFLSWINYVVTWSSFALIAAGVIGTLIKHKTMLFTRQLQNSNLAFVKEKIETEYFLLAVVCSGVLAAIIVLPYLSVGYGIGRTFATTAVILATFFVLGGVIIAKYLRISARLLILLILIPYSMFVTGALYEASGTPTMILSSESRSYAYEYVHDQETPATQWLKEHTEENTLIYTADPYGQMKLISQGKISPSFTDSYSFSQHRDVNGYLYLSYDNVVNGKLVTGGKWVEEHDMSEYADIFTGKNKLYANGGSEIWR